MIPLTSTARRTVRLSATYDLLTSVGFLPVLAPVTFANLRALHEALGLSGDVPTDTTFTLLFANLMGSLVVVWALFRLLRPTFEAGVADSVARLLFAVAMATAIGHGGSGVLIGFLVLEVAWCAVQAGVLLGTRRRTPAPTLSGC